MVPRRGVSGVYRIDLGNGRFYIGSALDLRKREQKHRSQLKLGDHPTRIVQSAFNLRGVFDFKVIGLCAVDELLAHEQVLLDEHFDDPRCANLLATAGSCLGMKHSPEAKAKISAGNLGKKSSPEARANMTAARVGINVGRKHSAKSRANMSAGQTGRTMSPETRAKISAAHKGMKASPETRAKMSAARAGVKRAPHSLQARANMSAAAKARWAAE